jgi:hypothetical protein
MRIGPWPPFPASVRGPLAQPSARRREPRDGVGDLRPELNIRRRDLHFYICDVAMKLASPRRRTWNFSDI